MSSGREMEMPFGYTTSVSSPALMDTQVDCNQRCDVEKRRQGVRRTFGFEEDLMAVLVSKPFHLDFNRRTVAWAQTLALSWAVSQCELMACTCA
jgi:hypothetical protein